MKSIGIFFGSRSPEHDISILTAMRALEGFAFLREYEPVPVYINKKGDWFTGSALGNFSFFQNQDYGEDLHRYAIQSMRFENGKIVFLPRRKNLFTSGKPVVIDLAFPCIHGKFGEDGTIQGLFEMAGIPYVGCGVATSAIAVDKIKTRRLLGAAGIPGVKTIEVSREEFSRAKPRIREQVKNSFGYPAFIKPNSLGSSIAVSRVTNDKELEWALEVAFQFDTTTLVEQAVENPKEVNVGVIGHHDLIISEPEEPRWSGAFQSFDEKYVIKGGTITQSGKGKSKSLIPADISPDMRKTLRSAAEKAFRALGASGITRFDFMINTRTSEWYLTEANTLPGTLQSHVWHSCGILLPELIKKLIGYAEERYEEERGLMRTFQSSVLAKK